eukprot:Tbor_TRINITY_DN8279_c0_g1::TRINITY_DN8279_c0_g1_i1::g.15406::m.15406/K12396/AP3D; AP-3 complex subunit delta
MQLSGETAKLASQILFQQSLVEVVRSLRNSTKGERETIEACIEKIKKEVSSSSRMVKVTAVVKLTYFTMLGYQADYGAFNVIEVMADTNFQNKRAGYIAASLSFNENTDVLPLCSALLRKDMSSSNMYEVGLTLYCLASVCTPDLAKELVSEVSGLLNHPKAYVRKKAVLCLYKIFLQFPESLRLIYPKLKDKIDDNSDKSDSDPSVRGAVVSIFCEMARRNPSNFLNLTVPFFSLLSTIHSNWSLIKVIKVFGYFAPLEPRLGKKLAEPISKLINTTGAKSVKYECILAVANGMSKVSSVTKLAVEGMKTFVEDRDQNLKYLGLDAMSRVMVDNPKILSDQRDTILECLVDPDDTIRRKALEILEGIATPKNLVSTVNSMFDASVRTPPDEDWTNRVIHAIIETVRYDDYCRVHDFEWYIGVLVDLSLIDISHFRHGHRIEREMVMVLTRVNAVRGYGVGALSVLLSNSSLLGCDVSTSNQWMVYKAAAFLSGEHPHWLPNPEHTLSCLLSDKIATMPVELQVLCIGAVGKIFAHAVKPCVRHVELVNGEGESDAPVPAHPDSDKLKAIILPPDQDDDGVKDVKKVKQHEEEQPYKAIKLFYHSVYPDVQEKAQLVYHLVTYGDNGKTDAYKGGGNVPKDINDTVILYERELLAVAAGAQAAVVPPEGLDLITPFCDDIPSLIAQDEDGISYNSDSDDSIGQVMSEELVRRREKARREEVSTFYLTSAGKGDEGLADLPPVTKLNGDDTSEGTDVTSTITAGLRNTLGRNAGKKTHLLSRTMAKPDTYQASTSPRGGRSVEGTSSMEDEATRKLKSIDMTKALDPDERLPVITPYANIVNKSVKAVAEESRRAEAALRLPPVLVHSDKHMRVVLQVLGCKAKKDGYHLPMSVFVTNQQSNGALEGVQMERIVTRPSYLRQGKDIVGDSTVAANARLATVNDAVSNTSDKINTCSKKNKKKITTTADDDKKDDESLNGDEDAQSDTSVKEFDTSFDISDMIKPQVTTAKDFELHIPSVQAVFETTASNDQSTGGMETPCISFTITLSRGSGEKKKTVKQELAFPIIFKYFAAMLMPDAVPSAVEFTDRIMKEILSSKANNVIASHTADDNGDIKVIPKVETVSATIPLIYYGKLSKKNTKSNSNVTSSAPVDKEGECESETNLDDNEIKNEQEEGQPMTHLSSTHTKEVMLLSLPLIKAALRLHTMEVFIDCCALYGQFISRKSHMKHACFAVLLMEGEMNEDGVAVMKKTDVDEGGSAKSNGRCVTVVIKGYYLAMLETAAVEVATIISEQCQIVGKELAQE